MKNVRLIPTVRVASLALMASLAVVGCQPVEVEAPGSTAQSSATARQKGDEEFVEGELLIQFSDEITNTLQQDALSLIGGSLVEDLLPDLSAKSKGANGLVLAKTTKGVLEAVNALKGVPGVVFAEPNFIYRHTATATDPLFTNGTLWGMYGPATSPANQYGSNAAAAWAAGVTGSSAVYVGIIDEGVQLTHPDLSGQVWVNPSDPVNGVDNDRNGYVDDINGWDFANNNRTVYDGGNSGNQDDHGTHVAGTIGAKANNGAGVVGLNWNIRLISAKFLGANGGTSANAVRAVDYLTNLKNRGLNVVASNNSWGGGGYSQALYDAISRANNAGILFIAAAGNSGTNNDATASYPANYNLPNVISVAAIDRNGALASFSQYGATTVDIGAPGVGVASTTAFNTYSSYNGTSMATPHVTGAVALYASTHPGASVAQIRNAILSSAVPTASLSGRTVTGGRLDANAALSR